METFTSFTEQRNIYTFGTWTIAPRKIVPGPNPNPTPNPNPGGNLLGAIFRGAILQGAIFRSPYPSYIVYIFLL